MSVNNLTRFLAMTLALFMMLTATGCDISIFDVDTYMRPPAASGYSAGIQQALTDALGTQYTLRYPRSGDHRSAVVMADLDGDARDEAIVFYRISTESVGAHMVVLRRETGDSWLITGEFSGNGGEIDRVLLCDLTGDGTLALVTGWTGIADGGVMTAHLLRDGALRSLDIFTGEDEPFPADRYSEMVCGDFNSDGIDELMTVYRSSSDGAATARMLLLDHAENGRSQLRTAGSICLDGSVYSYDSAQAGFIASDRYGMILDGRRDTGEHTTEAVYWYDGRLYAPVNDRDTYAALISRTLDTVSYDIDGDGFVEFPRDSLLPGYDADAENPIYLTKWYRLSSPAALVMQTILRPEQGYFFEIPAGWETRVTAQADAKTNTLYFYIHVPDAPFSSELFRIKVFTLDEWDNRSADSESVPESTVPADYCRLAVTDYYIYGALLFPEAEGFAITEDQIINLFHLYS